ncbi:MAG: nucleobase:cation symporter, family [Gaiellales bacterium]|jgi:NCS1 family nucleobase:cation symporter-1|nr:nucleobase:cation symporter, family [Gaiellales bacterium]
MTTETAITPAPSPIRGIEARSIDWVPDSERHGKLWHQTPLWFLGNFQYFSIPIGFVGPSFGLSLWWSILAGTAGILIGTVFMAFHASQGPTLGLPQMIQSRAQFGYRGVVVALFATLFTYLAFNVADQVLMSQGLNGTFGWNENVIAVVTAIGAALLAIYGHDWVHRVFRALLVVLFPLMTIITIGVITGHAGSVSNDTSYGFNWTGFMAQLSAAAAYNITYAPYVSDYSRYLPRNTPRGKIIASVFVGASTPAIWLIALGAWFAIRLGAVDGLVGLQTAGNNVLGHLGSVAAFFSACALAATMGMNAYGGSLTTLTGIDAFRKLTPTRRARVITIIALTVVWFVVGQSITTNAVGAVFTSLTLMLYLLVPWTATNLIDFFFIRRGHYAITDLFRPNGIYGVWSSRGLLAYAIGFASQVPFMVLINLFTFKSYYTGPLAKDINGVDISWIVGLVVTSVAYLVLMRNFDPASEREAIEASERELAAA